MPGDLYLMDTCKITVKKSGNLVEISQPTPLKMAFARKTPIGIETCHAMVLCRDFLNDIVYWNRNGGGGIVHGFKYNIKDGPIYPDQTMMLLKLSSLKNMKADQYIQAGMELFEQLEQNVGVNKTIFEKIDDTHVLITGDKIWQKYGPLISIWTCFLRLIPNLPSWKTIDWMSWVQEKYNNGISTHEIRYLADPKPKCVKAFFESAPSWRQIELENSGFDKKASIHDIHNFGFISLLQFPSPLVLAFSTAAKKLGII